MPRRYLIHDNYSKPFVVDVQDNKVDVYLYPEHELLLTFPASYHAQRVFVGKSPKNKMTTFSKGFGRKFDGNSILLELSPLHYLFIGSRIYSFRTLFPIVQYVSPVGNNNVPYPFAIDSSGQFYLMSENAILQSVPKAHRADPYEWYYFEVIQKNPLSMYVGRTNRLVRYCKDPDRVYDFLTEKGKLTLYDSSKRKMNKSDFVHQNTQLGQRLGIFPLVHHEHVERRMDAFKRALVRRSQ
jgi:hypothetical protein